MPQARTRDIVGIYVITHVPTGRQYVGMSGGIRGRWKEHQSALRHNRHTNKELQRDWNCDGAETFRWEVLENIGPCSRESLIAAEVRWIKNLDPYYCLPEMQEYAPNPDVMTAVVGTRLLKSEWDELKDIAAQKGMTASALVRQVVGVVLEEHSRREQEKEKRDE